MKIQHWIAGLAFMGVGCVEASHLEERTSAAATKQGALPEIYLIGDSIRIGYCKDVARELEGKADVRWPASDYADYCHFTPAANARLGRLVAERLLALAGRSAGCPVAATVSF